MTVEKYNQIIEKLLEKVNANGKIYLLKESEVIARECNVTSSDVIKAIQRAYLLSYSGFRYDLTKTRNNIKILALEKIEHQLGAIEYIMDYDDNPNKAIATYIVSQFYKQIENRDIRKIYQFYKDITSDIDNSLEVLYLAINRNSNAIYTKCTRFNRDEIDYILDLIAKHGYAYEKDNLLYWKTLSPLAIIEDDDLIAQFTIISRKEEQVHEEPVCNKEPVVEQPTMTLNTKTALEFIAKELGMPLTANESKQKLEEMIATTNELIVSFDSLPDWEKLKSWNQFVQDWQAIMGDAMNDRN